MPRGFLVKRQYIDTIHQHHHHHQQQQHQQTSRHSSTEDYSDHSTSSEDVPTDLSKRHLLQHTSPPIIHPYPPLPSSLFQPHLDFHSMVVERLQQRFEQQQQQQHNSLCIYPETNSYSDYFLPPLYQHHQRAPAVPVLATSSSLSCSNSSSSNNNSTLGAAGGLLLDLTIKASTPITPPATPSPVTCSSTTTSAAPSTKRPRSAVSEAACTPDKIKSTPGSSPSKKIKAVRRLHFDEDKSSPVSGTIIRELGADEPPLVVRKGDIDPAFNVVEVTEEAKAELAKIENRIGDYICKLCCEMYDDAFTLAQHRCSRIVHVEYRCPECDKVFNCPANLASHRRWHKPRPNAAGATGGSGGGSGVGSVTQHHVTSGSGEPVDLVKRQSDSSSSGDEQDVGSGGGPSIPLYPCEICNKRFRRQAYLKKHLLTHGTMATSDSGPSSPPPGVMCAPVPLQLQPPPPQMLLAD